MFSLCNNIQRNFTTMLLAKSIISHTEAWIPFDSCARNCVQLYKATPQNCLSSSKAPIYINEGIIPLSVAHGKSCAGDKRRHPHGHDDWPQLLIETNALSARALAAHWMHSQPSVVKSHFQATFVRQTVNNTALSLSPWIKSKILFTSQRYAFHENNRCWNRSLTASVCEWLQLYIPSSNKARQHSLRVFIYI